MNIIIDHFGYGDKTLSPVYVVDDILEHSYGYDKLFYMHNTIRQLIFERIEDPF